MSGLETFSVPSARSFYSVVQGLAPFHRQLRLYVIYVSAQRGFIPHDAASLV
ncbi:MAG: hypothetical protein RL571_1701 [Pseudomonadota bacterium]|jgi:hypothetical protein